MSEFLIAPWTQPRSCYSQLVTPPTEEPLTLAEAKLFAAMSWALTTPPDPRDQMIEDFIKAAREKVEKDTGLALLTQVRDVFFLDATDFVPLPAQCTPLQSLAALTPEQWATRVPFQLATKNGVPGVTFEAPMTGAWRVTAGWKDAATLRAEAPLLYHAVALLTAHYATLGRDLAITGAVASVNVVPEGYEDTIQPYRLVWVT